MAARLGHPGMSSESSDFATEKGVFDLSDRIDMNRQRVFRAPGAAMLRGVLFTLIWVALAGPDLDSWVIGLPAILAATWASLVLSGRKQPDRNRRALYILGVLRFVPFFLWESLRGGIDVAARVLTPRPRVDPGMRSYRMSLQSAAARLVFVDSVSLLPGTLSADLQGDLVTVHALDVGDDIERSLQGLERKVADLFDEGLDSAPRNPPGKAADCPI
jgi:multicomponent Na+:H+ antiporter subunit E